MLLLLEIVVSSHRHHRTRTDTGAQGTEEAEVTCCRPLFTLFLEEDAGTLVHVIDAGDGGGGRAVGEAEVGGHLGRMGGGVFRLKDKNSLIFVMCLAE